MTIRQAKRKYRKAVRVLAPDQPRPSFRAYARWLCVGDIKPTGKLAKICAH